MKTTSFVLVAAMFAASGIAAAATQSADATKPVAKVAATPSSHHMKHQKSAATAAKASQAKADPTKADPAKAK